MADLTKCRGCGNLLFGSKGRVISIQFGKLGIKAGEPNWEEDKKADPVKRIWGRMHERCFLLAIGDPRGVELTAKEAARESAA